MTTCATILNGSYTWGWDLGTQDYSCWILRDGQDIIGMWDHAPTESEIETARVNALIDTNA